MESDIQQLISAYSQFRGLVEPSELEALLFYFSEVGELAEAYLVQHPELAESQRILLAEFHNLGLKADDEVSRMNPGWVRNYDRRKAPDIGSEIGDCRMMLEKFSKQFDSGVDSEAHLLSKMAKKGFRDVLLSEVSQDLAGKVPTSVWNKVKKHAKNITIRDVLIAWHNSGEIPQLRLGVAGSKHLIEALGYYYTAMSSEDLESIVPIIKKG